MPIYLANKGHDLIAVGSIFSIFIIAGTISGLLAGYLADKIEIKKIFFVLFFPVFIFYCSIKYIKPFPIPGGNNGRSVTNCLCPGWTGTVSGITFFFTHSRFIV